MFSRHHYRKNLMNDTSPAFKPKQSKKPVGEFTSLECGYMSPESYKYLDKMSKLKPDFKLKEPRSQQKYPKPLHRW
jgi:hypothetical protein